MTVSTLHPARLWQNHPRETLAFGTVAAIALFAAAGAAWSSPGIDGFTRPDVEAAAPAPPPLLVQNVAPEKAVSLNSQIPVASGPNPGAAPFSTANLSSATQARALDCLTSAVYYEAGQESDDGQRGVAQVVLNRVRHPAFPSSVCGVVYQGSTRSTGCQFTFTCDGSLHRGADAAGWARARRVAHAALSGSVFEPVGWATHYHANYVVPYWASSLAKNAVIGAHLFYRWSGGWGRPPAFVQRYARQEPDSAALRSVALAAFASRSASATMEAKVEAEVPGAQVKAAEPGRVAVRFEMAREAAAKAPREPYVEKVAASSNLRWTLGEEASSEAPLGRPKTASASTGTATN